MLFLTSLMISSTYYWKNRNRSALGILICSAIGFLLLLLVPWNRFVPGFVLYQRYSPFFLIRHAREIFSAVPRSGFLGNSTIVFSSYERSGSNSVRVAKYLRTRRKCVGHLSPTA